MKVGDKVRIVKLVKPSGGHDRYKNSLGKEGVISGTSWDKHHHWRVSISDRECYHYRKEELELVEPTFETGEEVEVMLGSGDHSSFESRIYMCQDDDGYWCVDSEEEGDYICGCTMIAIHKYAYIRKLEPKPEIELTLTVNGKEVDPKDISDESWAALRGAE